MRIITKIGFEFSNGVIEKVFNDLGNKLKEKLNYDKFDMVSNWFELIEGTSGIVDDVYYTVIGLDNILVWKTSDIEGFGKVVD